MPLFVQLPPRSELAPNRALDGEADATMAQKRYPKRKRAQISYEEGPGGDDEPLIVDVESEDDIVPPKSKRSKKIPPKEKKIPKRKIFPFLELPAEIRNTIYSYCLKDPAGIFLEPATKALRRTVCRQPESRYRMSADELRPSYFAALDADSDDEITSSPVGASKKDHQREDPSTTTHALCPAVLAVCRQIHAEAHAILYDHTFHFASALTLHSFLVDIGSRAAARLKRLAIMTWSATRGMHKGYNHACFTALALAPALNVEKLTIYGFLGWRSQSKSVASLLYRDAFPWLEALSRARRLGAGESGRVGVANAVSKTAGQGQEAAEGEGEGEGEGQEGKEEEEAQARPFDVLELSMQSFWYTARGHAAVHADERQDERGMYQLMGAVRSELERMVEQRRARMRS